MKSNNFNPLDWPITKTINNYELSYIKQRYKEIHDFLHVLLNLTEINIFNELKLKQFEFLNL